MFRKPDIGLASYIVANVCLLSFIALEARSSRVAVVASILVVAGGLFVEVIVRLLQRALRGLSYRNNDPDDEETRRTLNEVHAVVYAKYRSAFNKPIPSRLEIEEGMRGDGSFDQLADQFAMHSLDLMESEIEAIDP